MHEVRRNQQCKLQTGHLSSFMRQTQSLGPHCNSLAESHRRMSGSRAKQADALLRTSTFSGEKKSVVQ